MSNTINFTGKTKYETKDFIIRTGYVKEGEIPQYLVQNKETEIVEFNHEVLAFVREWVAHFQTRLDDLNSGKTPEAADIPTSNGRFN
jgi:hypothetical protein